MLLLRYRRRLEDNPADRHEANKLERSGAEARPNVPRSPVNLAGA